MKRKDAIQYLKSTFPGSVQRVEECISEAEHQDGKGYWNQFKSVEELDDDFQLYVEVLEGEVQQ